MKASRALASSFTWTTTTKSGLSAADVDGGRGRPVAEPGVDVVVVGEVGAVGVLEDRLADLPPDVVDAVDADLVLERRELVEGPERVDLLAAGRVEVDAEVADRGRRQRLRGLGALLEEAESRPRHRRRAPSERDDAATDPPAHGGSGAGSDAPRRRGPLGRERAPPPDSRYSGVPAGGWCSDMRGSPRDDTRAIRRRGGGSLPAPGAPKRPLRGICRSCGRVGATGARPARRRRPGPARTARSSARPGRGLPGDAEVARRPRCCRLRVRRDRRRVGRAEAECRRCHISAAPIADPTMTKSRVNSSRPRGSARSPPARAGRWRARPPARRGRCR